MNKKIFILMFVLATFSAFASEGSGSGGKGDLSFIMNAGGGLGVVFGGFNVMYNGKTNANQVWTYSEFGGTFVGNFAITFDVGEKKQWSVGPALQLGYNGQAGPFLGGSVTGNGSTNYYTSKDAYGEMVVGTAKHAFITDLDFMARYSFSESRRLVLQAGLRMGAVVNGFWQAYKGDSDGKLADEAIFVAGPNIYFGADCVFGDSFLLEYGLRFSAAFWGEEKYGVATVQSCLDFAFELKFNWQKHFK